MSDEITSFSVENLELTRPMFRHKKRGTLYQVLGRATLQTEASLADGAGVLVYAGADGTLWVRAETEFLDGRFERADLKKHRGN